jgi:eukaryotic-like serine/threonine-protein kinase
MDTSSDAREPVEALAEEFMERRRRGEKPTMDQYVRQYPELAEEIRDLFPALLIMEDLGQSSGGTTGTFHSRSKVLSEGISLRTVGDYRLLREVGRGGMGVVYEAEQISLGRRVALKILPPGALMDPRRLRRFEREARSAARLHHTNIVPVFGVGEHDGTHYYVMQFIQGLGLDEVLDELTQLKEIRGGSRASPIEPRAGRSCRTSQTAGRDLSAADMARSLASGQFSPEALDCKRPGQPTNSSQDSAEGSVQNPDWLREPAASGDSSQSGASPDILVADSEWSAVSDSDRSYWRSVARIGVQVAEALDYANRQNVLHRDIKPSNLLLDMKGNIWVTDFGLAKAEADDDDLTHTGDIVGTVRYMAPERFQGRCDARADVYSLALTLYELLALRPAFEGSDRHRLLQQVDQVDPPRLRKLNPSVPRDLETIIHKAMAREPERRYATAAAMAEDLQRLLADKPIQARRIGTAERLVRWFRRNPLLAAATSLAAVALIAVAVLGVVHATHQTRTARQLAAEGARTSSALDQSDRLARDLAQEVGRSRLALRESSRLLTELAVERAVAATDQGDTTKGLLWLAETLQAATEADNADLQHFVRVRITDLYRQTPALKMVFPHFPTNVATNATLSRDGLSALCCGPDGRSIQLHDVATGEPLGPSLELPAPVIFMDFSPDGRTALVSVVREGDDEQAKSVRLWDGRTGEIRMLEHTRPAVPVAICPRGKIGATGSHERKVHFWDLESGTLLCESLDLGGIPNYLHFSPNGEVLLVTGYNGVARFCDPRTGEFRGAPLEQQGTGLVRCFAFSADSGMALTMQYRGDVRLWDVATCKLVGAPYEHEAVTVAALSPRSDLVLTGGQDGTVRVWDVASGNPTGDTLRHRGPIWVVAFDPSGKTIVTGSQDNTAQLWDATSRSKIGRPYQHQRPVYSVQFGEDGTSILTGGLDGTARLWHMPSGPLVGQPWDHPDIVNAVTTSPNGRLALTGGHDGVARLWEVASGKLIQPELDHGARLWAVAIRHDEKVALTGGLDGMARRWNLDTGEEMGPPLMHGATVYAAALSPDGHKAVTGGMDSRVRIWDAETGQPIGEPLVHQGIVRFVEFSPDSRTVVTGGDGRSALIWDANTGQQLAGPMEHADVLRVTTFRPDGREILTGGWDHRLSFWDASSGEPRGASIRFSDRIMGAAYSPDGRIIFVNGLNGSLQFWDAASRRPLGVPWSHGRLITSWVAFGEEGRIALSGSSEKTVRAWDVPRAASADAQRIKLWAETITAAELDGHGVIRPLDAETWSQRREQLNGLGGPPEFTPARKWDPDLDGPQPEARPQQLAEQEQWDEASTAFDKAVEHRPSHVALRVARARFLVSRGRHDESDADWLAAIQLAPHDDDPRNEFQQVLVQRGLDALKVGDLDQALRALEMSVQVNPDDAEARFGLARAQARRTQEIAQNHSVPDDERQRGADEAIESLRLAVALGITDSARIDATPDFESLRSRDGFHKLLGELEAAETWFHDIIWQDRLRQHHTESRTALTLAGLNSRQRQRTLYGERLFTIHGFAYRGVATRFAARWLSDKVPTISKIQQEPETLQATISELPPGYRPKAIEFYPWAGGRRYSLIATREAPEVPWQFHDELDREDLQAKLDVLAREEFRPAMLHAYADRDGQQRFLGVWVQDGVATSVHVDLTATELRERIEQLDREAGWRPAAVQSYLDERQRLHLLLLCQDGMEVNWRETLLVEPTSIQSTFDQHFADGYIPIHYSASSVPGRPGRELERETLRNREPTGRILLRRAYIDAALGDYQRAAELYQQGLELDASRIVEWQRAILLQAWNGNQDPYAEMCQQMIQRFQGSDDVWNIEKTIKSCLLLPDSTIEPTLAESLAEKAASVDEEHPFYPYLILLQGIMEYRAGRFSTAATHFDEVGRRVTESPVVLRVAPLIQSRLFLAMIHAHENRIDEAHELLAEADAVLRRNIPDSDSEDAPENWYEPLLCQLWRREAERQIEATTSGYNP